MINHIRYTYWPIKNMYTKFILAILLICCTYQLDNGLGLTPAMGWNSWNHYGCNINEQLIKKTVDQLVATGLAAKGYRYVNLDDCWQIARDSATKEIIQDKSRFPSGMKALSDYTHSKGLKFGLYSDAGQKTCAGRPGSLGYETIDATTYARWEIDYLKYDNCYNTSLSGKIRYYAMSKALNQSGRYVFFSMCNWGTQRSWEWAEPLANSWRTTGDISDNWNSFTGILDQQVGLEQYAKKGGWNDPDMLEVGNGGMTFDEYYLHFAMWCILKSPLLIGCSLDNISNETLTILGNEELIAINQDQLGKQGYRITKSDQQEVWGGDLSKNRFVVAFLNRGSTTVDMSISIKNDMKKSVSQYTMRDAIEHQDLGGSSDDIIKVTVRKHAARVLVLSFLNSSQNKHHMLKNQLS